MTRPTAWWRRLFSGPAAPDPRGGGRAAAELLALAAAGPGRAAAPDPGSLDYETCYARCDDVYAAVSLLADNAATVPLLVHQDGRPAPGHELQLLLDRVNPWQGATKFWTRVYSHLWLTGECFILTERSNPLAAGLPNELWAFSGRVIEPVADPEHYLSHYRFRPPGRGPESGFDIAPRDVVPITLFNPLNPLRGLSPLSSLRLTLASELHAKRTNHDLFANGLMTDVALSFDFVNEEQRNRTVEALRQAHAADGRRHGFLILENNTRVDKLSLSPRDAEFVELDRLTTRDVAKAYRIPPMFLAQMDHATLRNFETAYRALWELAILPRVRQVAGALTEHLARQLGPGLSVAADASSIESLRVGDRERAETFAALVRSGIDAEWAGRRVFGSDWSAALLAPRPARPYGSGETS
ncbi:MAG: phage portal protein [Armatimonadetes bacterium]|nr:phage portal protein [Armatimonadota bacterium]